MEFQESHQDLGFFTLRLPNQAIGADIHIVLPHQFTNVEKIFLQEQAFVEAEGSFDESFYFNLRAPNFTSPAVNNEGCAGTLLHVSYLTPHMMHPRPRLIATADKAVLSAFDISLKRADGSYITYGEATLVFVVLSHKPLTSLPSERARLQYQLSEGPKMNGPDPRSTFGWNFENK